MRCARRVPEGTDAGVAAMMTGDPLGVLTRSPHRAPSPEEGPVIVVELGPVGLSHLLARSVEDARVTGIEFLAGATGKVRVRW